MKTLGVVGLGYVGLPLAVQAAAKGYKVTGIDLNAKLIAQINNRQSPYVNDMRFSDALRQIDKSRLSATNSFSSLKKVENIVVCVPTPTESGVPDLRYVSRAAEQIATYIKPGQFVSFESTVNPGVTRDVVLPLLEKGSGLKVGEDFFLAHCPERIDPGNDKFFVGNLNRVVGGITDSCTQRAVKFYSSIIDAKILPLKSAEEAEFVKSWENSHRNVMIALANSAAVICDALGMDVARVLEGLQSKVDQFGLSLAKPGIGPGGHCIPEDIHYVIRRARQMGVDTRLLDDAADLNDNMPRYAVHKLSEMVRDSGEDLSKLSVALLGLAYKPEVADVRCSPSIEVAYSLIRCAKSVIVQDPYAKNIGDALPPIHEATSLEEALRLADVIFLGTGHKIYIDRLTAKTLMNYKIRYVLDGRNVLDKSSIEAAGIGYRGIGR